jgi:hypothetical protein
VFRRCAASKGKEKVAAKKEIMSSNYCTNFLSRLNSIPFILSLSFVFPADNSAM